MFFFKMKFKHYEYEKITKTARPFFLKNSNFWKKFFSCERKFLNSKIFEKKRLKKGRKILVFRLGKNVKLSSMMAKIATKIDRVHFFLQVFRKHFMMYSTIRLQGQGILLGIPHHVTSFVGFFSIPVGHP